jgi:Lecithin retinol acyltransferase
MPDLDLPIGAHLSSPRRGYVHHGLYAGQGRVIHYAGFNRAWRRGVVEEVELARFTRGRALQIHVPAAPSYVGAAAVARARTRLGEDNYRFWTNNCEHFVLWCLTGQPRSVQVERWVQRLRCGLGGWPHLVGRRNGAGAGQVA